MASEAQIALSPTERRVVDRLVEALRREFADELHGLWLYGSRARGEKSGALSDVDLLAVASGDVAAKRRRATELVWEAAQAERTSPLTFSLKVFSPEWVADRRAIDSFFIRAVDRDKIVLAGDP